MPATGLFMLCPGAGTAVTVGLHAGQVATVVAIVAVATSGLVGLVGVLAVNFPAIQRARSQAAIYRAVLSEKLPPENAVALIRADEDDISVEQPSKEKRNWRSFFRRDR